MDVEFILRIGQIIIRRFITIYCLCILSQIRKLVKLFAPTLDCCKLTLRFHKFCLFKFLILLQLRVWFLAIFSTRNNHRIILSNRFKWIIHSFSFDFFQLVLPVINRQITRIKIMMITLIWYSIEYERVPWR